MISNRITVSVLYLLIAASCGAAGTAAARAQEQEHQADAVRAPVTVDTGAGPVLAAPVADGAASADQAVLNDPDLWVRVRQGFAMSDLEGPIVDSQLALYTAKPELMERNAARASKYLYHIVEEIERRHLPMELALLPFVESSFNPNAMSSAKASGMWQFMPATGQMFKLKQNLFKDERRDIVASTDAALTFLEQLHDSFGDWQLALAAYNWGEGSVRNAMMRNQAAGLGTDYAALSPYMPLETRNYVPRLQAVKAIISQPELYGITLPTINNEPYFESVSQVPRIDIATAARMAEMSVGEFKSLNPQFNRSVITGADAHILLPTGRVEVFRGNLLKWGRGLTAWTVHKVMRARERAEAIARHFGATPEQIREVNHIPSRMQVAAGSTVLVPAASLTEPDMESAEGARLLLAAEPGGTKAPVPDACTRRAPTSAWRAARLTRARTAHGSCWRVRRGNKLGR